MPADPAMTQAVKAAIVGAAHLAAWERVESAAAAVERLGGLSSGRWRSAARDLARLEADLQTGLRSVSDEVARRAEAVGVPEETLWTVGEAAEGFDALAEDAAEALEEGSAAARLLEGDELFGVTFVEDADHPNRGVTLLHGWTAPFDPATWPWEAAWIARAGAEDAEDEDEDEDEDAEEAEELDLFAAGGLAASEDLLATVTSALNCTVDEATEALTAVAAAFTRASLLAAVEDAEGDASADDDADLA